MLPFAEIGSQPGNTVYVADDAGAIVGCFQLTSNRQRADALRFYESLGFEPTHIGFKLYL